MSQMIVRSNAARKFQMFCKLSLFLIDQGKKSKSVIMIQSTFRMHKIRSQYKKIILSTICMQSFVRCIIAQNDYELKVNAALLLQKIWRMIEKRKNYTQIMAHIIILQKRWRGYCRLSNYNNCKSSIIILQAIVRGSIVRTTEWNRHQAVAVIQRCFMNYKLQLKELDKMQTISVVIKLQAFGRGIIQRKADVCKLKAICMIQSNVRGMFVRTIIGLWLERSLRSSIIIQSQYRAYYCKKMFFKVRSGIISLQSFTRRRIVMTQMIVRNNAARKVQIV